MFFILLRVLFCTPLILTAIGSPIFLVENPAAPATVTVSASVWSPTATLSTLPFSPLLGGVNYPAVSFGNALSSLFRAASGSSTAQGAVPSVLAPAASALDAAAAAPTLFAAAELSSNTVSDAGFVTAVGAANVTAKALIKASNTLVNTLLLIIHGLAANNIPANVISNFVVTSGDYDAKITALTKAITGGVAEVDTAYLTTSIASIANDIDGETAQVR
ncbi:hypothetical protein B0H17DRAFT_457314 [Mycena rosella]|uniref:Uncharacterized protein n=1 Tax=Mycena rosella TaxID=1033263 RepID=A0AAD7DMI2_MYCRO|nr:hypothetical protein B0H17DRAFT_457314 [Mycena rosella]